jgi:AcrR family transcriptional regulator
MTEKKEKILKAALTLFTNDGYNATSTSKVSKEAGVSEGLIFRHFRNKEGLLNAILEEGEKQAKVLFADIVMESEPKEVIRKTLEIGQVMKKNPKEAHFWKLQYKIKWETERYGGKKMEPLHMALRNAFEKLGYAQPAKEAELILINLDGMALHFFLDPDFDLEGQVSFLRSKYEV